MLLCVWYYVKDRLNYIFSFLEGILIWKTTIALRHAPRSISSILSLFYTFLHLYLSVVLFIYLFIHTYSSYNQHRSWIAMLDDMRCFTRVECTVQIFAPFFSVFKKFSRVFLRQPGEDGKSGGLVGGVGWGGCGGWQGINVGAEGAAARRVRRTAGRVETGSASRHQTTVAAVACGVKIVVELLHSTLHVGWKSVRKVPLTAGGRVGTAKHRQLLDGSIGAGGSSLLFGSVRLGAQLIQRVDKVAAGSVGAEANTVVGAAHVGLVLGVAVHCSQLLLAVGKLAFFAVLAHTVFLEGAAHLRLVPEF